MAQTLNLIEQEDAASVATLSFEAEDVTGNNHAAANVQASLPVSAITSSLVATMALPSSAPYGLRDEMTGAFLQDDRPIGEQIGPGARLTVTPKPHLG